MKKILMIGTGGTIACRQTSQGLTPALSSEELLEYIPEAAGFCEITAVQVCNVDSTNITPVHWALMSKTIQENYDAYDGFVLCHGTDTLAYTAAALSYMIQNSKKPIVITGSQKPINREVTDARRNLLDSFIYAADEGSHGVTIVFDGNVILGTRARKIRAKSYNAFASINFPCPAVVQDLRVVRYLTDTPLRKPVRFCHEMKDSICVMKMIPGSRPELLSYLFDNYDCIVLESFGVGGIPASIAEEFYRQMKEWNSRGKYVVMATQVVNEGSNMEVYEVGRKVKEDFQLIEAFDMTLEATITKMMWLMSLPDMNYEKIRKGFYTPVGKDILLANR